MKNLNTSYKNSTTIIIHILIWIIFFTIVTTNFYFRFGFLPNDFLVRPLIYVSVFYLNYNLLVPRLLLNKKIFSYIVVIITFILFFILILEQFIPLPKDLPFMVDRKMPPPNEFKKGGFIDFRRFLPSLSILLLFFALSTSIRLVLEWYKIEKQSVLIKSQKTSSELAFLKMQLKPHFLFNSLNSIYSLANKKSEDTTEAIVILSELMRYMIYETNKELINLKQEINYIQNYISLQKLRIKDASNVYVNIRGSLNYKIEPLLFISFIENAFKFGTDYKGKTNINLKININNDILHFYIKNSISTQQKDKKNSGIGLKNVKNRLQLLYPKSHELIITKQNQEYIVNLTLKLKKNDPLHNN